MTLNSLKKEWTGFSTMIFQGTSPSQEQYDETKKAFYAGSLALMTMMNEIGEDDVDEVFGMAHLDSVHKECEAFYEGLRKEQEEKERPLLKDMDEPTLQEHIDKQMRYLKSCETQDTIGTMLVIFQYNGITQYGASVDPTTAPDALRDLANRLEARDGVERGP